MASWRNGTLYVGVTSQREQRVASHRNGLIEGFRKRSGCKRLVWFEMHDEMLVAIAREKQLTLEFAALCLHAPRLLGPRVAPAERPRMTAFKNQRERDPTRLNLSPM